jgi:TRAP-type C4-dicarboxylate transport system permease small subunit
MPVIFKKIFDAAEKAVTLVAAFLLLILALLVCIEVVCRLLGVGASWIADITIILMMWIGLLGAAGCVWTNMHMRLNLVLDRIPAAARLWVHVFIDLLLGAFALFLFVQGIDLVAQTMGGVLPTLPIPVGITYIVVPLAAALMAVFSIMNVIRRIWDHFTPKEAVENG